MPEILAQVEESIDITATVAATPGSLTDDYNDLQNHPSINGVELVGDKTTNDLHIDHVPLADNLVATTGTTSTTPYTLRSAPSYAGSVAELRKVVGGTLAWNQYALDGNFPNDTTYWSGRLSSISFSGGIATVTPTSDGTSRGLQQANANAEVIPAGHKLLLSVDVKTTINATLLLSCGGGGAAAVACTANTWKTAATVWMPPSSYSYKYTLYALISGTLTTEQPIQYKNAQVFDLTNMFGSTIADAIYTMETTTAGSGVAFFRSLFPSDYYPYSAPTLQSVQTSARQALDGNGNVIRTYPLDSDLTLRGVPKIADGALYYDGDEYLPSGQVTRRYATITIDGTEAYWYSVENNPNIYNVVFTDMTNAPKHATTNVMSFPLYTPTAWNYTTMNANDFSVCFRNNESGKWRIYVKTAETTLANLKTYLGNHPLTLVYELDTPTTEQADPFTEVQLAGETEQFVCDNYIPVGNETIYPTDLTGVVQNLAPLPTSAGTYKLQVTVSGGVPSYSWVAG